MLLNTFNVRKPLFRFALAAVTALLIAFVATQLAPKTYADTWNKQTKITFSEAVQVPGRTLEPGTYTFRLLDSPSDRHIVQIFDANGQRLITTVLAIPNYRLEASDHTTLRFDERLSTEPQAIKAWFYPGDLSGQEFVYPKGETLGMARVQTTQPVEVAQSEPAPVQPTEPAPAETVPTPEPTTPAVIETPAPEATPEAEAMPQDQPVATPQDQPAATPAKPTDDDSNKLPKTASEIPLIAALGTSALGLATMLRSYRRRNK